MNVDINWIGVIAAVVVSMALGFLWYSPMVLGKPWMKLKGHTAESMKKAQSEMGKWYVISALVSLVQAYVLAHVMALSENFFHYSWVATGLSTAFWMWLGFVAVTQVTATLFGDRKWKLFAIDAGYQLVSLLGMGVVLGLVR